MTDKLIPVVAVLMGAMLLPACGIIFKDKEPEYLASKEGTSWSPLGLMPISCQGRKHIIIVRSTRRVQPE